MCLSFEPTTDKLPQITSSSVTLLCSKNPSTEIAPPLSAVLSLNTEFLIVVSVPRICIAPPFSDWPSCPTAEFPMNSTCMHMRTTATPKVRRRRSHQMSVHSLKQSLRHLIMSLNVHTTPTGCRGNRQYTGTYLKHAYVSKNVRYITCATCSPCQTPRQCLSKSRRPGLPHSCFRRKLCW